MLLYSQTIDRAELDSIAAEHGLELRNADASFSGARRRRVSFVLRPGAGMSDDFRTYGQGGRRVHAVNWEGHFAFMADVFELDADAEIKSALAHWRGRADFLERAGERAMTYGSGTLNCSTY